MFKYKFKPLGLFLAFFLNFFSLDLLASSSAPYKFSKGKIDWDKMSEDLRADFVVTPKIKKILKKKKASKLSGIKISTSRKIIKKKSSKTLSVKKTKKKKKGKKLASKAKAKSKRAVIIAASWEDKGGTVITPLNNRFREMVENLSSTYVTEIIHVDSWHNAERILFDHDPYDLLIILGHGNTESIRFSSDESLLVDQPITELAFRSLNADGRIICCACSAGGEGVDDYVDGECRELTIAHHLALHSPVTVMAPLGLVTGTDGQYMYVGDQPVSRVEIRGRVARADLEHAEHLGRLINESFDVEDILEAISECPRALNLSIDSDGNSLLHIAVYTLNYELISYLIENYPNLDINSRNAEGDTPLHVAVFSGDLIAVRALLAHPGINLRLENRRGETARALNFRLSSYLREVEEVREARMTMRHVLTEGAYRINFHHNPQRSAFTSVESRSADETNHKSDEDASEEGTKEESKSDQGFNHNPQRSAFTRVDRRSAVEAKEAPREEESAKEVSIDHEASTINTNVNETNTCRVCTTRRRSQSF